MVAAFVRVEITANGDLTVSNNITVDRAIGLLEMGKFALMNGSAKPTSETRKGEAPAATIRAPEFAVRGVA